MLNQIESASSAFEGALEIIWLKKEGKLRTRERHGKRSVRRRDPGLLPPSSVPFPLITLAVPAGSCVMLTKFILSLNFKFLFYIIEKAGLEQWSQPSPHTQNIRGAFQNPSVLGLPDTNSSEPWSDPGRVFYKTLQVISIACRSENQ